MQKAGDSMTIQTRLFCYIKERGLPLIDCELTPIYLKRQGHEILFKEIRKVVG